MAKAKPEFQEIEEFPQLLTKFLDLNGDSFPDLRPEHIKCFAITNKEKPETKRDPYTLTALKAPFTLFCPVKAFVVLFQSDWDVWDEANRGAIIARICWSLVVEEDEAKVVPPDTKEQEVMLRTFGVGYLNRTGGEIPNALAQKIEWKFGDQDTEEEDD